MIYDYLNFVSSGIDGVAIRCLEFIQHCTSDGAKKNFNFFMVGTLPPKRLLHLNEKCLL